MLFQVLRWLMVRSWRNTYKKLKCANDVVWPLPHTPAPPPRLPSHVFPGHVFPHHILTLDFFDHTKNTEPHKSSQSLAAPSNRQPARQVRDLIMRSPRALHYLKTGQRNAGTATSMQPGPTTLAGAVGSANVSRAISCGPHRPGRVHARRPAEIRGNRPSRDSSHPC